MNYRHLYHAGNFADVFKHWVLTLLIEKMQQKDSPICFIDAHAGIGLYDLTHPKALATEEAASGIELLEDKELSQEFMSYMNVVNEFMLQHKYYPGSPAIMERYLRRDDKLILSELHPEDVITLRENFAGNKQITILQQDAYQTIRACLPPKQTRALVLLDPSFEKPDEFTQLAQAIKDGLKRFATGVFAVWYPIKDQKQVANFYMQIQQLKITKSFYAEIHTNKTLYKQLKSCGLLIINPPWQLDSILLESMPKMLEYLHAESGEFNLNWLHTEK